MTTPQDPHDIGEQFLQGDTATRLKLLRSTDHTDVLRRFLGTRAHTELVDLAGPQPQEHLATTAGSSLVFVPGVMGSVLVSRGLGGVWWLDLKNRRRIDSLALAPDGTNDSHSAFRITPAALDMSYEGFLIAAAAHQDHDTQDFPYDWRKPLSTSADALHQTILAASATTPGQPVHVVAHSMGGLVLRTALMRHPDLWNHVGRIVFIGTPHYGSPAIGGYLKNHLWGFELLALLGRYLSRDTFRSLTGVLSLLPAPAGTYPSSTAQPGENYDHPCANFDLYDATAWHLKLTPAQQLQLQARLDDARQSHQDLHLWHNALDQGLRDRMAIIAGTGFKTLFRLSYTKRGKLWHHMDRVTSRQTADPHRDGDGRVPLASATLTSIAEIRYINGEHASLPNLPDVQRDVWNFLAERPMRLAETPAAALEEHLGDVVQRTSALALPRIPGPRSLDDPGYLNFTNPTAADMTELEKQLENGQLPDFMRTRLL
ncbi:lipase family alpha/beta hydrolase [Streptomyces sp. NPDC056549]|uniref:lipase family alpha/beta hydrolase n=1 Tax=Streptomyces sp. NPDC056549 TaxID=3345864 RepID=UPI00368165F1